MAEPDAVGANPDAAMSRGDTAETYADAFTGLVQDFATLVGETGDAAAEMPCRTGYTDFLDAARPWLFDVQEHGADLSHNIRASGARAGATDVDASGEYATARDLLAAGVEVRTGPYTDLPG